MDRIAWMTVRSVLVEFIAKNEGKTMSDEEWFAKAGCEPHVKRVPVPDVRKAMMQMMGRESRLEKRPDGYYAVKGAGRVVG
jgi:hypothetical protein